MAPPDDAEVWGSLPGSAPFFVVQGEPDVKEARIAKVFPNTPAEKAGIRVGDLVVELDGMPIEEFAALSKLVADRAPGDKVKGKVKRGEETLELEVTIGTRSD